MKEVEDKKYISFYDDRRESNYAHDYDNFRAEDSTYYGALSLFINTFELENKKVLEIGSSGGFFQDMVLDYTGVDIAESLRKYYHKPYSVATGVKYPFNDNCFDGIWTFAVYEHIPHLQEALLEIKRLLKPGGVVLFQPAWQCRTWAADGYNVRPYDDFNLLGKLVKFFIPLRNNILYRSAFILPKRIFRSFMFLLGNRYFYLKYKKIRPNYEIFWESDSDACNHIDMHDAFLWFKSHGFDCLSHPSVISQLTARTGGIILQKKK